MYVYPYKTQIYINKYTNYSCQPMFYHISVFFLFSVLNIDYDESDISSSLIVFFFFFFFFLVAHDNFPYLPTVTCISVGSLSSHDRCH